MERSDAREGKGMEVGKSKRVEGREEEEEEEARGGGEVDTEIGKIGRGEEG